MIAEYLNRDVVLDQLQRIIADLHARPTLPDAEGPLSYTDLLKELQIAANRERATPSGPSNSFGPPPPERRGKDTKTPPLDDFAFISSDAIISLVQSALDEHSSREHPEEVVIEPPKDDERRGPRDEIVVSDVRLKQAPPPRRTPDGRRIFDKFSITDIRWVQSKIAEGIRAFQGKHDFNKTPANPCTVPERVRLIVVGDWGSGLPRARKVARQMRTIVEDGITNGLAQQVVHLGDVYYSGWAREYRDYVFPYWPVKPSESRQVGSWALNGNHDMYSGGQGFFDVMLADPRFHRQQQSSFFSFVNKYWKILSLDTSWNDADVCEPQPEWIDNEIRHEKRRVMFLSHHQLFSVYETDTEKMIKSVVPILQKRPIDAWFWGHEHRCMLHKPYKDVRYGRCIGHGGVPVYMWHEEKDAYPAPGEYEYRAYYKKGLERWAVFGFAVLDFNGADAAVRYIDENGWEHKSESLEATSRF